MPDLSGIGSAVGGVAGAVSAIANLAMSAEQEKRAQALRDQAKGIQAPEIAPQFLEADRIAQWRAQNGMPGLNQYKSDLDRNLASGVQSASGVSGSGANTLAAVTALYNKKNQALGDLNAKDASYRDAGEQGLIQSKQELGNQVNLNRQIQLQKQNALQQGANQLENASSANKLSATKQITNSLGHGLSGVVGSLAGSGGTDGTTTGTTTTPSVSDVQAGYGALQLAAGLTSPSGVTHPSQDTPENIMAMKQFLLDEGLYTGPIDGNYDPDLETAISQYDPTGVPYNTNLASVAPLNQ